MPDTFTPEQIAQILEEFFKVVGTRQYIGARYVPIFGRKGEDSIEWDNTAPYEPLTIVLYQGNSYTSRQFVPVGVEITNQEFWAITGNYNAQVEMYRRETAAAREIAENALAAANTAQETADGAQTDINTLLPKTAFSADNTVKNYVDAIAMNAALTIGRNFSPQHSISDFEDETNATLDGFNSENPVKTYVDEIKYNTLWAFDTIIDMQVATYLTEGMVCHTNGFRASGDGGAAYYVVASNGTANGMDIIELDNGLRAKLIVNDHLSYSMLGAVLDGVADDSAVVRKCHELANLLDVPVVQNCGKLLGNFDTVVVNTALDLHGLTIVINNDSPKELYSIRPREFIAAVVKNLTIDTSTNFSFTQADLRGKFFLMHGADIPAWFIGTRTTSTETSNNYYSYPVVTDDYGYKISSPFDLNYAGNITLRNVHDVNQPRIMIGGCYIENHYTQSGSFPTVFHVMRSCVDVCDISVRNVDIANLDTADPNAYDMKGLIHVDQCANVNVYNISAFNNSNQALMAAQYNSYILRLSYCFNVTINNVMATQYWGWIAGVFVDTIRMSNSVVNRFDFHFGLNGDCTLSNVTFRNQDNSVGIRVGCGYGNLQVVNCKFIDVYMISFRNDFTNTGLSFGGSIQMVNCNHQYGRDVSTAAMSVYVGVTPSGSSFAQTSPSIMLNGCTFNSNNTILAMPTTSVYAESTEPLLFNMYNCIANKSATFRFRHCATVGIRSCEFFGGLTVDLSQQDIEPGFKHVLSDLQVRGGRLTINGGNSMILVSNINMDGSFVFDTSHFTKQIILTNVMFFTSAANIASSIAAMASNTGNVNWKWCYSVNAIDRSSVPGGIFDCQNIS